MKRWIIVLLGGLIAIGIYFHPFFRLEKVQIMNGQFTSKIKMQAFFDSIINRNMLWVRWSPQLKRNVLNEYSKLDNIQFEWAENSTLKVVLIEKKPWILFMDKGTIFVGAEDGTLLTHESEFYESDNYKQLIVVQNTPSLLFNNEKVPLELMTRLKKTVQGVRAIFPNMIFQIALETRKNPQKQEEDVMGTTLIVDDVLPIYLGKPVQLQPQLQRLRWYFNDKKVAIDSIEYIDLRVEGKIFVKPTGSS